MIEIYPGLRVIDQYYKPEQLPFTEGTTWIPRNGIVTRIDHPDRRKCYVKWDDAETESEVMLFWLTPEDMDVALIPFRNRVWYASETPGQPPPSQGDSHEEKQEIPEVDVPFI